MVVETGIYYFADYVVTTDEDAPLFTWDLEIPVGRKYSVRELDLIRSLRW
jgi:hypothetical protein